MKEGGDGEGVWCKWEVGGAEVFDQVAEKIEDDHELTELKKTKFKFKMNKRKLQTNAILM